MASMKIHIREENIDGCGGFADTAVRFQRKLTREEVNAFASILVDVKRRANENDECLDTDDMVQEALTQFQSTAAGKIVELAHDFIIF